MRKCIELLLSLVRDAHCCYDEKIALLEGKMFLFKSVEASTDKETPQNSVPCWWPCYLESCIIVQWLRTQFQLPPMIVP